MQFGRGTALHLHATNASRLLLCLYWMISSKLNFLARLPSAVPGHGANYLHHCLQGYPMLRGYTATIAKALACQPDLDQRQWDLTCGGPVTSAHMHTVLLQPFPSLVFPRRERPQL